jgi:hypothetical protein
MGKSPTKEEGVRLGLTLGPELDRRAELEREGKEAVGSGLRVGVSVKQAVEA